MTEIYERSIPIYSLNKIQIGNTEILQRKSRSFGSTDVRKISNSFVQKAVNIGESIANNVTRFIQSRILQAQTGSSSFFHAKNQKQRPGVQKLGRLAIDAVIAGYSLAKNVGTPNGIL